MSDSQRKLAVVTGASTGIGLELARECAKNNFDLIIAANEAEIESAAEELRRDGGTVEVVQADLATTEGVDKLFGKINGRAVSALLANAGRGLGKAFLDQDFDEARHVVEYQRHRHDLPYSQGRPGDARAGRRPHPYHRLDCRFHAGLLPGRLQRHQSVS